MSSWELGIDFGTSYTVVAVAQDGNVATVDVESNGRSRLPSSVFLSLDGQILVGTAAQHQAVFAPERYEPTPKRVLGEGELFLGDRVDPGERARRSGAAAACTQRPADSRGRRPRSAVRITHPADWNETREVRPERSGREGGHARRTSSWRSRSRPPSASASPAPSPARRSPLRLRRRDLRRGGAAAHRRADSRSPDRPPAATRWAARTSTCGSSTTSARCSATSTPRTGRSCSTRPTSRGAHKATDLREEVQRAKETLSEVTVCQLWVPGIERDVQLTRGELEKLIATTSKPPWTASSERLDGANVKPKDLAGIYLVGGSSRIPLVGIEHLPATPGHALGAGQPEVGGRARGGRMGHGAQALAGCQRRRTGSGTPSPVGRRGRRLPAHRASPRPHALAPRSSGATAPTGPGGTARATRPSRATAARAATRDPQFRSAIVMAVGYRRLAARMRVCGRARDRVPRPPADEPPRT